MLATLIALVLAPITEPVPAIPPPACRSNRDAALRLSWCDFDQGEHSGWRALSEQGCEAVAADLIAAYRAAHPTDPGSMLHWHQGQMRAFVGDYVAARPLFAAAYLTKPPYNWFGWNDYVAATIAFIDRDHAALLAARERLAATPRPATHGWTDPDGNPIPPPTLAPGKAWPEDLPAVDALVRCFDRSYKAAYLSADCAMR